jgi:hypothetical protein
MLASCSGFNVLSTARNLEKIVVMWIHWPWNLGLSSEKLVHITGQVLVIRLDFCKFRSRSKTLHSSSPALNIQHSWDSHPFS